MTIEQLFATYRDAVIPQDAGPTQIRECRQAFYAGAHSLLLTVQHAIQPDTPDDVGIARLEALEAECEAFTKTIERPLPIPPEPSRYTTDDVNQIRPVLLELGRDIKARCPDGWGFTLLLFTLGEAGNLFYLSSANRADVIRSMQEFIAREVH